MEHPNVTPHSKLSSYAITLSRVHLLASISCFHLIQPPNRPSIFTTTMRKQNNYPRFTRPSNNAVWIYWLADGRGGVSEEAGTDLNDMHIKQIILMDKMSIAYQLYLMSNTNHIIIPLKNTNPSPQRPLSFTPTPFASPLHISQPLTQNFLWRKTNSAFSKFKARKDKNVKNQFELIEDLKKQEPVTRRKVSLVVKDRCNISLKQQFQEQMRTECPFGYYDPNEAPLCELMPRELQGEEWMQPENSLIQPRSEKQKHSPQKMGAYSSSMTVQGRQLQKKDSKGYSYARQVMVPEDGSDDPFIIIRKDSQTKNHKQYKAKFSKKTELLSPLKSVELESDGRLRVGNKIVQKSVLRAEQLMKNINSVSFSPPIKVEAYPKPQQKGFQKSQVIQISEQHQVIEIESSSQEDPNRMENQIEIE